MRFANIPKAKSRQKRNNQSFISLWQIIGQDKAHRKKLEVSSCPYCPRSTEEDNKRERFYILGSFLKETGARDPKEVADNNNLDPSDSTQVSMMDLGEMYDQKEERDQKEQTEVPADNITKDISENQEPLRHPKVRDDHQQIMTLSNQKLHDISARYNFAIPLLDAAETNGNQMMKHADDPREIARRKSVAQGSVEMMVSSHVVGIPYTSIFFQKNIPSADVIAAIDDIFVGLSEGMEPIANRGGSSGSYFMKGSQNSDRILAIFKPKDEEVYSLHNPKMIKYFQRHMFPCCFGRGCISIGLGYQSEAGAYAIDRYFNFNLVPPTYIVNIASKRFNYFKIHYPKLSNFMNLRSNFDSVKKIGSIQMFVHGYQPSNLVLPLLDSLKEGPVFDEFLYKFQKMTILDYLIRNTDRNKDNWLIKYDPESEYVDIAAIDNGLAFPFKHPDQWRAYPYHWSTLKWATMPYTDRIRNEFVEKLNSTDNIEQLTGKLYDLFSIDKKFDRQNFQKQMAVLRGQVLNLVYILSAKPEQKKTPQDLLMVPVMFVIKGTIPLTTKFSQEIFIGKIDDKRPMFTCF